MAQKVSDAPTERRAGEPAQSLLMAIFLALAVLLSPVGRTAVAQTNPPPSGQQSSQLEEIVVTANRAGAENIQQVPMAISVVTPQAIEDLGMTGFEDYSRLVPGLSLQEIGPGYSRLDIRGIVTTGLDVTNVQDRSLVAFYYDDTPITLQSSNPDLKVFDLERVEVLKGPQGTLYGAGAMAGTVRLITVKPDSDNYTGTVETTLSDTPAGYGGFNYSIRGMANIPLAQDKAAFRIIAYREYDTGFIKNVFATLPDGQNTGDGNRNDYATEQARAALRLTPTDQLTIDSTITYMHTHGGLNEAFDGLGGPYRYTGFEDQFTADNFVLYNTTVGYDLDNIHLSNSTSYLDRHINTTITNDYNDAFLGLGLVTPGVSTQANHVQDVIEEARMTGSVDSVLGSSDTLKFTAGVFYENFIRRYYEDEPSANFDSIYGNAYVTPGYSSLDDGAFNRNDDFSGTQDIHENQVAIYAEATYSPLPGLDLTAGLRYFDWHQKFHLYFGGAFGCNPCSYADANGNLVPGSGLTQDGDAGAKGVNPRFAAAYHFSDDVMVYSEAAKGFRYGGVNQPTPLSICLNGPGNLQSFGLASAPIAFGPDKLWQYSLGEKSTLMDHRLTVNADGFYIDWQDVQTEQTLACSYYYVVNKGQITSKGLEFDTSFKATPELTLSLNGAYTDATANGNLPNIGATSGEQTPYFPKNQASFSATYVIPMDNDSNITLEGNYSYKGKSFNNFNPNHSGYAELPSSTDLNLSINYITSTWEVGLYGHNITDDLKVINYSTVPNPLVGFQPGRGIVYARPRTFGIRAKANF
jgi:outer membrane receptor protein involved in Fe transport